MPRLSAPAKVDTSLRFTTNSTIVRSDVTLGEGVNCPNYWIGGQCQSGNCSWTDGSKFDFDSWGSGQPDVRSSCVLASLNVGTWSTQDCTLKQCFVCETVQVMADCNDWYNAGYRDDGEYFIDLNNTPYKVYCDMNTEGGGWTVFQRRVDGSDSFWNHTWEEYKLGFGEFGANSNFWLGNELLHQLTAKDSDVTLRVEMTGDRTPGAPTPNAFWYNHYYQFKVGAESTNYSLDNLYLDWRNNQGNASTGWYDLTYSIGAQFSTIDRINDPAPTCVTKYHMGGWWLRYCAFESLNGDYNIADYNNSYGLFWIVDGLDYIIHPRQTRMMLRPTRKS
ncbi:unnamed protein product [Nippostrongylus brasiliensis]|uniref:Fibrinogen C-terminal domain-containing protein n=1 Tax=Nippostrongylus brasiliensis TaxID=27835 RepID=A0A0N4YP91_NIPBR|nr:unnamed protein product [Nippostrongylus brasiliensis]